MAMTEKFRMSPTPSGKLHKGNALNFVLNWWQARLRGASLLLRIDDHDETRKRPEYVEDVFEILEWLGLDWDEGPKDPLDFEKNFSQAFQKEFYREELLKLPQIFWCQCSRSDLRECGGEYPGTCRELGLESAGHAGRLNTDSIGPIVADLKDCILWRKDDLPAYQLVSVLEDQKWGITHVLRGMDLHSSSVFQLELARLMGLTISSKTSFLHHRLLTEEGKKLSKSQKASPIREEFSSREEFYEKVVSFFLYQEWSLQNEVRGPKDLLAINQSLFK